MSYDIYAQVDVGGKEPLCSDDCVNTTSNIAPMLEYAFSVISKRQCPKIKTWYEFIKYENLSCEEAGIYLELILIELKKEENYKNLMNLTPENGWGSLNGLINFVEKAINLCNRYPKATFVVSY